MRSDNNSIPGVSMNESRYQGLDWAVFIREGWSIEFYFRPSYNNIFNNLSQPNLMRQRDGQGFEIVLPTSSKCEAATTAFQGYYDKSRLKRHFLARRHCCFQVRPMSSHQKMSSQMSSRQKLSSQMSSHCEQCRLKCRLTVSNVVSKCDQEMTCRLKVRPKHTEKW